MLKSVSKTKKKLDWLHAAQQFLKENTMLQQPGNAPLRRVLHWDFMA